MCSDANSALGGRELFCDGRIAAVGDFAETTGFELVKFAHTPGSLPLLPKVREDAFNYGQSPAPLVKRLRSRGFGGLDAIAPFRVLEGERKRRDIATAFQRMTLRRIVQEKMLQ